MDEKLYYFGDSLKNSNFRGVRMENQYRGGDCVKKWGAWRACQFKGELGKKEGGGVFEGERLIPQCTLRFMFTYIFLAFFFLFFFNKKVFFSFSFLFL